jgi:hypothetical protein
MQRDKIEKLKYNIFIEQKIYEREKFLLSNEIK